MHVIYCWTTTASQPTNKYGLPIVYEYHYCLINKPKGVDGEESDGTVQTFKTVSNSVKTRSLYPALNLIFTIGVSVGRIGDMNTHKKTHEHNFYISTIGGKIINNCVCWCPQLGTHSSLPCPINSVLKISLILSSDWCLAFVLQDRQSELEQQAVHRQKGQEGLPNGWHQHFCSARGRLNDWSMLQTRTLTKLLFYECLSRELHWQTDRQADQSMIYLTGNLGNINSDSSFSFHKNTLSQPSVPPSHHY